MLRRQWTARTGGAFIGRNSKAFCLLESVLSGTLAQLPSKAIIHYSRGHTQTLCVGSAGLQLNDHYALSRNLQLAVS